MFWFLYCFFNHQATTEIYTLSLHDALPIYKNFASVFSLMIQDMNDLESEFLKLMGFDFFLSPKEFNNYAHLVQLSGTCQQISSSLRPSSANVNPNAVSSDSQGDAVQIGRASCRERG